MTCTHPGVVDYEPIAEEFVWACRPMDGSPGCGYAHRLGRWPRLTAINLAELAHHWRQDKPR